MANVKITLVDKQRKTAVEVEVDENAFGEAAILVYRGDYYVFSQVEGKFYQRIVFMQVEPPVHIG